MSQPLTGREIAGRVKRASHEGVRRSLERLVDQGIVIRQAAGGAYLHTLNREHLAAPAVLTLAVIRTELWARLRSAFASWDPPAVHASAYGSAARGDGDTESDVDLFVIRPAALDPQDRAWREQIELLERDVRAWTGNDVSVIELDEVQVSALVADPPPALRAIREDGIGLAGLPARTLLDRRLARS